MLTYKIKEKFMLLMSLLQRCRITVTLLWCLNSRVQSSTMYPDVASAKTNIPMVHFAHLCGLRYLKTTLPSNLNVWIISYPNILYPGTTYSPNLASSYIQGLLPHELRLLKRTEAEVNRCATSRREEIPLSLCWKHSFKVDIFPTTLHWNRPEHLTFTVLSPNMPSYG
jgi:hypothetical protein